MYSFETTVRYSEVDKDKRLSALALVDYFQDCSSFHSDELGVGFDALQEAKKGWVISYWQIVINDMPEYLDKVKVGTFPYEFDTFYGYRNFILEKEDGTVAASANSIWVFIDTNSLRPTRMNDVFRNAYTLEARYDKMNYEDRKITLPEQMEPRESFVVKKYNLDTNYHVNNGQYIQMAQEYLPEDFVIGQIRAVYKHSAVLGDAVYPYVQSVEGNRFAVDLRNDSGATFAIVEFTRK